MMRVQSLKLNPSQFCHQRKRSKKKGKRKQSPKSVEADAVVVAEEESKWVTVDTLKEAINAGWKPGQIFSFIATNVKGQKLLDQSVVGAKAIGAGGSGLDLNNMISAVLWIKIFLDRPKIWA